MLDTNLARHASTFQTALNKGDFDVTDDGILFPHQGAVVSGEYHYSTNDGDTVVQKNLIPTEGLDYILSTATDGGAQLTAFYLAIFSGSYTPVAGVTAATFPSAASEITSATEGYSESTRPVWAKGDVAAGVLDNLATRAAFTIVTASSLVIRGAALLSSSAKGSTSGKIVSITRFSQDRTHYNGDVFNLGYRLRLQA